MRKICAWCEREAYAIGVQGAETTGSHVICAECGKSLTGGRGVGIREFIDQLKAPVLIVTGDLRVEAANPAAVRAVGLREIEKMFVGDVMECPHAQLPEGCGEAKPCIMGCTLRRVILETLATGKPAIRVEARQEVSTARGVREMRFWLSTVRVAGRVLLRIDSTTGIRGSAEDDISPRSLRRTLAE